MDTMIFIFSEGDKRDLVNAIEIPCYRLLTVFESIASGSSQCTSNTCSNYELLKDRMRNLGQQVKHIHNLIRQWVVYVQGALFACPFIHLSIHSKNIY